MVSTFVAVMLAVLTVASPPQVPPKAGDAALGTPTYDNYERPAACATCHVDIARQHEQAMMSQAYTHHWDEIEYFELAVPHADKEPKVAGVKAGCNGCHAPLAFLAGDVPPQPPAAKHAAPTSRCPATSATRSPASRATRRSTSTGSSAPGKVKQGPRDGVVSPHHETRENPFLQYRRVLRHLPQREETPAGTWVKATHLEWKEGPHGKAGIVCQDCHMPPAAGRSAHDGRRSSPDMRQHLFHGAHDPGKLAGVVEVRIHPETREAEPGDTVKLTAVVVNAKAGHKIPSGSAEERVLWLHVEATDAEGQTLPPARRPQGLRGRGLHHRLATRWPTRTSATSRASPASRASSATATVPAGDRIFRLPYLDPKGRMTIAQWNTASFGPDYRLAPLQAVSETFTWKLPAEPAAGPGDGDGRRSTTRGSCRRSPSS